MNRLGPPAWHIAALAFCGVLLLTACAGYGQSVGIQFSGTGTPLPSGQMAGVVSQANWNVETVNAGSGVGGFVDSSGTAVSGLTLSWTSDYVIPGNGDGSSDTGFNDLFSAHLESPYSGSGNGGNGTVAGNRVSLLLTNIPYTLYDIYVYTRNGGNPGSIFDSTTNFYTSTANIASNSTALAYTDGAASTYQIGVNYVEFTNLSGAQQFLLDSNAANTDAGGFNSGIAGIQIVAVPEPSTWVLGVVGGGLLLGLRRARRKLAGC